MINKIGLILILLDGDHHSSNLNIDGNFYRRIRRISKRKKKTQLMSNFSID